MKIKFYGGIRDGQIIWVPEGTEEVDVFDPARTFLTQTYEVTDNIGDDFHYSAIPTREPHPSNRFEEERTRFQDEIDSLETLIKNLDQDIVNGVLSSPNEVDRLLTLAIRIKVAHSRMLEHFKP